MTIHLCKQYGMALLMAWVSPAILWTASANVTAGGQVASGPVFVSVDWLDRQPPGSFILVDARRGAAYRQGHIPGAVNISVDDTFEQQQPRSELGGLKQIQALFARNGIRHGKPIVVYAGKDIHDAGRVFWVFEVFGHKHVKILDGGFSAWRQAPGNQPTRDVPEITPVAYVPTVEPGRLVTLLNMKLATANSQRVILDVRTTEEYNGEVSFSKRFGHIPGAINIPSDDNFVERNGILYLKPEAQLRKMYRAIEGKPVITYCNKGLDAALTYTILRALGQNVSVYDGSWFEWGNSSMLPVENKREQTTH